MQSPAHGIGQTGAELNPESKLRGGGTGTDPECRRRGRSLLAAWQRSGAPPAASCCCPAVFSLSPVDSAGPSFAQNTPCILARIDNANWAIARVNPVVCRPTRPHVPALPSPCVLAAGLLPAAPLAAHNTCRRHPPSQPCLPSTLFPRPRRCPLTSGCARTPVFVSALAAGSKPAGSVFAAHPTAFSSSLWLLPV